MRARWLDKQPHSKDINAVEFLSSHSDNNPENSKLVTGSDDHKVVNILEEDNINILPLTLVLVLLLIPIPNPNIIIIGTVGYTSTESGLSNTPYSTYCCCNLPLFPQVIEYHR